VLGAALWPLFLRQSRAEQAHALRVWRRVQALGGDVLVQQAALLHDVGKSRVDLHLVERALAVLGRRLFPARARGAWAQGAPRGWRRAFVVAEQHATWGAEWARAAGAPPAVVALIQHHHAPRPAFADPAQVRRWALLRQADEEGDA